MLPAIVGVAHSITRVVAYRLDNSETQTRRPFARSIGIEAVKDSAIIQRLDSTIYHLEIAVSKHHIDATLRFGVDKGILDDV